MHKWVATRTAYASGKARNRYELRPNYHCNMDAWKELKAFGAWEYHTCTIDLAFGSEKEVYGENVAKDKHLKFFSFSGYFPVCETDQSSQLVLSYSKSRGAKAGSPTV